MYQRLCHKYTGLQIIREVNESYIRWGGENDVF